MLNQGAGLVTWADKKWSQMDSFVFLLYPLSIFGLGEYGVAIC